MITKLVIPRDRAVQDVEEIVDYYLAEGSEQKAISGIVHGS
ncbi:hypothetical protein [Candidatus Thiosymbion oneisti]|nr:hypothetical protein [Candidatus Thiosymbion oneisti]